MSKSLQPSFVSSLGAKLFKNRSGSSVRDRRGSTDSMGFQLAQGRSRSLENIAGELPDIPPTISELRLPEQAKWCEIEMLKTLCPHVLCILPSVSLDFVASSLLAIGATALIPEDVEDINSLLGNCKGVVVDTSAKTAFIEEYMEQAIPGLVPLVLVVTNCGTDDRRKGIARKIIENCSPAIVSGRLGDIHAVAQDFVERADGTLEEDEGVDSSTMQFPASPRFGRKSPIPGRKSKSPPPGPKSGSKSPVTSPHFQRREVAKKYLGRTKTPIPHLLLKGQFRHEAMKDVSIPMAVESGRLLAAQHSCYVHMYEVNTVTCGEFFIEVTNPQLGMVNIHSTVQCLAGIFAATFACVEEEGNEIGLNHSSHALALYHVAAEEASIEATLHKEFPPPGLLRVCFIDRLQQLSELIVRLKSLVVKHNEAPER